MKQQPGGFKMMRLSPNIWSWIRLTPNFQLSFRLFSEKSHKKAERFGPFPIGGFVPLQDSDVGADVVLGQ